MTVDDARRDYLWWVDLMKFTRCRNVFCGGCQQMHLETDAASLAYDLANAEASIERTRRGVAWG
jgi:hypothetical protein